VINREDSAVYTYPGYQQKKRRNYRHKRGDLLEIHSNNALLLLLLLLLLLFHQVPVSHTKKQKGMFEDSNTSKKICLFHNILLNCIT
jgi:hypothetical protein